MAHLILIAVMFVAAVACIIRANIVFYQTLDEVNAKLPPERQISFLLASLRMFGILDQHAGFFPSSRKRKRVYIWLGVGFTLLLLVFLLGLVWGTGH
jgi:hypothetical protein